MTTIDHLRRLVVNWHHSDVKADPWNCSTQMVGYGQNELNVLRIRTNVCDRRHVGDFHEVHCMLKPNTVPREI